MYNLKNTIWEFNDELIDYNRFFAEAPFHIKNNQGEITDSFDYISVEYTSGPGYMLYIYFGKGKYSDNDRTLAYQRITGAAHGWTRNCRTIYFNDETIINKELYNWLNKWASFKTEANDTKMYNYIHLYHNNQKILVDAAIRDAKGHKIDIWYASKNDLKTVQQNVESTYSIAFTNQQTINEILKSLTGPDTNNVAGFVEQLKNISTNLTDLQGRVTVVEERLDAIDGKEGRLETIESAIETIDERTKNYSDDILNNKIVEINSKLSTVDSKLGAIDGALSSVSGFESRIKTNEDAIAELKNIQHITAEDVQNLIEQANFQEQINTNIQAITDIKTNYATKEELSNNYATKKELSNVNTKVENLSSVPDNIEDLRVLISTNKSNIEKNETAIGTNATNIGKNAIAIGNNTIAIGTNASNIADLQDKVKVLSTVDVEALQQLAAENNQAIKDNKALIDNNKTLINSNKTLIDGNKALIDSNESRIDNIEQTNTEQAGLLSQHGIQIAQLYKEIYTSTEEPSSKITELEGQVDSLISTVTGHSTTITLQQESIANLNTKISEVSAAQVLDRALIDDHATKIIKAQNDIEDINENLSNKQDKLTAGSNIEIVYNEETKTTTINSTAEVSNNWGAITGNIVDQVDLKEQLDARVTISDSIDNNLSIEIQQPEEVV